MRDGNLTRFHFENLAWKTANFPLANYFGLKTRELEEQLNRLMLWQE